MANKTILIIEDQKDLVRLLENNLQKEGFQVASSTSATEGLALVRRRKPDLIILDVMLPEMDGFELCRRLRQETQVPVIFLTAKDSELDRILGLRLGADDYIVKPFSVGELVARIQAIFRRTAARPAGEPQASAQLGKLAVDFEKHETRIGGKSVELTPKEFELLRLLIEAEGKVLSRDTLLERIWGHSKSMEIDTRTVDQHVARLRKKLGAEGQRIATVTNFGYQVKTK